MAPKFEKSDYQGYGPLTDIDCGEHAQLLFQLPAPGQRAFDKVFLKNLNRLSGKVGFLGGSSDPVQQSHIDFALEVKDLGSFKSIVLMPNPKSPSKEPAKADIEDRINMLVLAARDHPALYVSPLELQLVGRNGSASTPETIAHLIEQLPPKIVPAFIGGSDLLEGLHLWPGIEKMLDQVDFVLASRPGHPLKVTEQLKALLTETQIAKLQRGFIELRKELTGSSTKVREEIPYSILPWLDIDVPAGVNNYIAINQLYGFTGTLGL